MSADYKYIIVGQGLAGTCLALEYQKMGIPFLVIDHFLPNTSSRVAAGMVNPVTFKRVLKAWNIDTFLPVARETYHAVEKIIGEQVIFDLDIFKVFALEDEADTWAQRRTEGMESYLELDPAKKPSDRSVVQSLGGGMVKRGFWLDVPLMLGGYRKWLIQNGLMLEEHLDIEEIQLGRQISIRLGNKQITTENIVFCEGPRATDNPLFAWLPFRLAKGELLTIKAPELDVDFVINRGMFVLPLGNDLYKVGSTFNWEDLTTKPTQEAREELVNKLERVIRVPYEIVNQTAGVRPTIAGRRPFLGAHPQLRNTWIFNGLGARGVAQAPFFARHLSSHQEQGTELWPEVCIARYEKRYRKSLLTHDYFL